MSDTRVTVDNGKYTFIVADDGAISVLRFGEPWLTEQHSLGLAGSKALIALIHHAAAFEGVTRQSIARAATSLRRIIREGVPGSVTDDCARSALAQLVGPNRDSCETCALAERLRGQGEDAHCGDHDT